MRGAREPTKRPFESFTLTELMMAVVILGILGETVLSRVMSRPGGSMRKFTILARYAIEIYNTAQ